MQGRSRMAAWIVAAASVGAVGLISTTTTQAGGPPPIKQKVKLDIRLDGISIHNKAEIEIKPGNSGCRFKPVTYPVKGGGWVPDVLPIDVETLSADRDCSFAITLKEAGQADKVFRRSVQIAPVTEATAGKPQSLICYLNSRASAIVAAQPGTPVVARPTTTPIRK